MTRCPFRDQRRRLIYLKMVELYQSRSRALFLNGKPYRGGAIATRFWDGFQGIYPLSRWTKPDRDMLGYVAFRAGLDLSKRSPDV